MTATDLFAANRAAVAGFDPRSLPPLSPLAKDLLRLDIEDDNAESILIRVVESDPQLSIRLVSIANSVAYNHSGQSLGSVAHAVRRIGLARTKQVSIAMLFGQTVSGKLSGPLAEGLWVHALSMAFAAQEICRIKHAGDPGTAYLAGLVHDLGYMVEELCAPGALNRVARAASELGLTLEAAEQHALGAEHAALTFLLLRHWQAPAEITDAINRHHDLDIEPDSLAAILYGAEKLSRFIDVSEALHAEHGDPFSGLSIDRDGLDFLFRQQLELGDEAVTALTEKIIDQVESFRQCARAMHGAH